jgi:DNA-binding response OmpR family regulator
MSDQQKHILCIDDEPDMLELLTIILKRTGVKVSGVNNGIDGLRMIAETKPDLVILDLMMPFMGGWEVYQQIKADENIRHIPVIIVTAKAQQVDRVLGIHIAKVEDYITKPFSPSELVASVTRVLNKQQE